MTSEETERDGSTVLERGRVKGKREKIKFLVVEILKKDLSESITISVLRI